ncbi:lectin-like protein [Lacipirellula limnantheis]|nr:lectin-like protein [Lacipirellula limnantheis]
MQRILLCALFCAASLSAVTPAFAWMSEPARNPDNGHYYAFFTKLDDERFIRPAMPFADALTRAASISHLGIPGHLATITSQAEQDFVLKYFKEFGRSPVGSTEKFWIGASDAAIEGEWRWVGGPEEGQVFWRGSVNLGGYVTGQSIGYHNWPKSRIGSYFLEPNNAPMDRRRNPDGEDYLALYLSSYGTAQTSYWNDVIGLDDNDSSSPRLAIVEFSVIPEPSSATLTAISGAMLVAACRRRG